MASVEPPRRVTVGANSYTVTVDNEGAVAQDAEGICIPRFQKIYVAEGMGEMWTRQVLMHELIHAMLADAGGLPPRGDEEDDMCNFEEDICNVLAPRLLDLLRRNPRLVTYLTSSARSTKT